MTLRLKISSPEKAPYAAVVTRTTQTGSAEKLAVIEPGGEADVYLWNGVSLVITEQPAAPVAVEPNPEAETAEPAANS
jgi:hypothetical protein